ncbi:MAG: ABC transporter ATP-binding protein [Actinobacteria bacterium]|nr:ABC transporter ATP-binding protein [Actinomycetota bacterium]
MNPLVEYRHVTKIFSSGLIRRRRTVALEDVTFRIDSEAPVILAIAGESGSGKTTLARLLLGLISPTTGEVLFRGRQVDRMSRAEHREFLRQVQPIFQDPFEAYNPFYKVDHVLVTPAKKFGMAKSKAEVRAAIERSLDMVGLRPQETLGRFPHQLSGGQRQRVMVARALMLRPGLVVADEPVSMVDASLRATILESLRRLRRELSISVVYITHDLTTAYQIADHIVVLYKGSVAEAGSVDQVIKDPKHPYTQLLVRSIPQPDVDAGWGGEADVGADPESSAVVANGCKFVDRCPFALPMCVESRPPLFQTDPDRAASCFLYTESPVLPEGSLDAVMRPRTPALLDHLPGRERLG